MYYRLFHLLLYLKRLFLVCFFSSLFISMQSILWTCRHIFGNTLTIIKKYWRFFLLMALWLWLLQMIGNYVIVHHMPWLNEAYIINNGVFEPRSPAFDPAKKTFDGELFIATVRPDLPLLFWVTLFTLFMYIFVQISFMDISFSVMKEKNDWWRSALHTWWNKLWIYIWTHFLQWILLLLWFMLFIIPWIYFMVYWLFSMMCVVYYNKKRKSALNESKEIVRGRRWKTLGYLFLLVMLLISAFILLTSMVIWGLEALWTDSYIIEWITMLLWSWLQVVAIVTMCAFFWKRDTTRIVNKIS